MNKEFSIFNTDDFSIQEKINKDFFSLFVVVLNRKTQERFFAQINQRPDENTAQLMRKHNFSQIFHPAIQNIIGFSEKDFSSNNFPVVFSLSLIHI